MGQARPFRALRFDPSRVDLARVLGGLIDPRHARVLLDDTATPRDGRGAAALRAKARVADMRRAGILRRDDLPSMTYLKRIDDDGTARVGVFCAVEVAHRLGDAASSSVPQPPHADDAATARLAVVELSIAPVLGRFLDPGGRLVRALSSAADREPDLAWRDGASSFEAFVLDDESTTARVTTLLSTGGFSVDDSSALEAHRALARRQPRGDDDPLRAIDHALCFLSPDAEPWSDPPIGVALLPLAGALLPGDAS